MTDETPLPGELDESLVDCVPAEGPIADYMQWAIKTTDAEHLFHLGSVLPVIGNEAVSAGFRVDPEQLLRPSVWTFLVGVPASSKSTAQKRVQMHYRQTLATRTGAAVRDPFVQAEGSLPGLHEALAERYDPELGLSAGIVTKDEAAKLLEMRDSVAEFLCQVIDGDEVQRHLRGYRDANKASPGSAKDRLVAPAFSGTLATTFAGIRRVTQASYIEGGLYSRFLWFVGQPSLAGLRLEVLLHRPEQRRVIDSWIEWSKWLLGQQLVDPERIVTFEVGTRELLRDTLFAELKKQAKSDSRMNASWKRGLTQAKIVAALYALSQYRREVTYDDMSRAINLLELCLRGLTGLESTLAVHEDVALIAIAKQAIQHAGAAGISRSSLYPLLKVTKRQLDSVVDSLLDEGSVAIATAKKGPGSGSGRPANVLVSTTGPTNGAAAMPKVLTAPPPAGSSPRRPSARSHLRMVPATAEAPVSSLDASDETE